MLLTPSDYVTTAPDQIREETLALSLDAAEPEGDLVREWDLNGQAAEIGIDYFISRDLPEHQY